MENKKEFARFNINEEVYVKLKDKGIAKIVMSINEVMPFKYQTSFAEFEANKNEEGYHTFQMWDLISHFGGLGMSISQYIEPIIMFKTEDLE